MAFTSRGLNLESDGEATARLAACPEGSINHFLSTLPVRNREWPDGQVLYLPRTALVVVPFEPRQGSTTGSWNCKVVAGNDKYAPGGYDIVVSRDEIRRAVVIGPRVLLLAGKLGCGDV